MLFASKAEKHIDRLYNANQSGGTGEGFLQIFDTAVAVLNRIVSPSMSFWENVFAKVLTGVRILFLVLIIILISVKFLNIWNPSSHSLYHGYSIIKLIYYLMIAITSIYVICEFKSDDKYSSESIQTLLPIGVLKYIQYFYDIVLFIIFSGILQAYYISSCKYENKGLNPNTYFLVNFIKFIFFLFIIIGFLFSLLASFKNTKTGKVNAKLIIICGMIFYLITFLSDAIEFHISSNINYWNNINIHEDCTTDEDKDNNGFQYIVNILISIVNLLIIVGISILQSAPHIIPTNIKIRAQITEQVEMIIHKILEKST